MVETKLTRTYNKLRFSPDVIRRVREWGKAKGILHEDASIVKVIGSKVQIDEIDALLKPLLEAVKPAEPAKG